MFTVLNSESTVCDKAQIFSSAFCTDSMSLSIFSLLFGDFRFDVMILGDETALKVVTPGLKEIQNKLCH
jgi:hypothetical protein